MAATVLIVTTLLGIGFLATRISTSFRLPHSVLLVLVGMLGGAALNALQVAVPPTFWDQFPDLVLYVLLPPLIFESAYNLNLDDLRRDVVPILALAVVALLISCFAVGWGLHLWLGIKLPAALLFGALISATDPVAVVALFKEIGAPRRLSTLVEGESLLNDGTAIVLFRVLFVALAPAATQSNLVWSGTWQFLVVALGGVGVGLVFVLGVSRLLRLTNPSGTAQLGLTVAAAYGSFIVADHYSSVSGVISTMVVGLYLGHRARLELNREALHSMHVLWEFLSLCANTLIFLAVGLSMHADMLTAALPYLIPTLLIVGVSRALSVWGTILPLNPWPGFPKVSKAYQTVLIWGGLRGGLALALVFQLPPSFEYRPLFLALASGVVLFSLLVNALTTAPLLRRLGLTTLTGEETSLYQESLHEVLTGVIVELSEATRRGFFSSQLVGELRHKVEAILTETRSGVDAGQVFNLQRLLLYEQNSYNNHIEDGVLSPEAYLTLSRMVADRLALVSQQRVDGLAEYPFDMPLHPPGWNRWMRSESEMGMLTLHLEQRLHLDVGLREADEQLSQDDSTRPIRQAWLSTSAHQLEEFYKSFPHLGVAVQAEYLAHRLDVSARGALDELRSAGVIEGGVHARAVDRVGNLHRTLMQDARRRREPRLVDMLPHITLFAGLPPEALQEIASRCLQQPYAAGAAVVTEDTSGDSLFVVLSGILEVQGRLFASTDTRPRLFAGSFFGEMSLLFGTRRTATVVCLVPSQIAEITRSLFDSLCERYPQVQTEVQRIAVERQKQNVRAAAPPPAAESRLYSLLAGVPLLAELPVSALSLLATEGTIRRLTANETVVQEGDPGSSFFLLVDGSLQVTSPNMPSPVELHKGEFFGEMSLLFGGPRTATVTAMADAEVIEVHRQQFELFMRDYPALARQVRSIAEARLAEV